MDNGDYHYRGIGDYHYPSPILPNYVTSRTVSSWRIWLAWDHWIMGLGIRFDDLDLRDILSFVYLYL